MLRLFQLNSLKDLRCEATAWDDLWDRSDVAFPTARAELVAQWLEQFAPQAPFCAMVVEGGGKWLAALLLVEKKLLPAVNVGALPVNSWSSQGLMMLDPRCDTSHVLDLLAAGVSRAPWGVLWLDEVTLDAGTWHAMRAACSRAGMACSVGEDFAVARLEVDHDWEAFTQRWSGSFRRQNLRLMRRLAETGEIGFQTWQDLEPDAVEPLVRRGFEVEHRSWKGRAGSSVLAAGMLPFFVRQAQQLAQWGQLHLTFLECAGQPIAFIFGAVAKGVLHVCKIGYDEQYAKFDPGHLIHYNLLRELWQDPAFQAVDWVGEAQDYQLRWRPTTYRLGRMVVGRGGLLNRLIVHAHQHWWPHVRHVRQYLHHHAATRRARHGRHSRTNGSPGNAALVESLERGNE